MKKEKISDIIGLIGEKYTDEATAYAAGANSDAAELRATAAPTGRSRRRVWVALAACIAAVLVIGSAATAFALEAQEYKTAVSFFEENGLSTDGLSRSEIKEVYKDITTKKFKYGKTAEVIQNAVPGREIEQDEPTPEELAALWDKNVWVNTAAQKGINCRLEERYVYDAEKGFDVFEKSIVECYRDGKPLWSAEFKDFYADGYACTKEGTAIWGMSGVLSASDTTYAWIALVDGEGNILWQKRLEHGFKNEYVASVLSNGDGTWAVISRGDLSYLCLGCRDSAGNELSFHKTEVGNFGIRNAARLGDGYIVQLWNQFSGDTALLYKMDRDGVLTDSFSYEADDCDYYITDMAEFEGRVYLSAYAVPKQKDEGGRYEIGNILGYLYDGTAFRTDISSEELTPIVRGYYTAMLLLCDSEGGVPGAYYSVKGSLGGKLNVNGSGMLEWNVESITSTFFSPLTSSFTIGGVCKVYTYSFDSEGNLVTNTDTGLTVPYRR